MTDPMFYGRHMAYLRTKGSEFFPRGAIAFFGLMIAFVSVSGLLFYAGSTASETAMIAPGVPDVAALQGRSSV